MSRERVCYNATIMIFKNHLFFLGLILTLFLLIATFKISEIPGEWFGDISILHEYVVDVLNGKWPFYFSSGGGLFYYYMVSPLIAVFGNDYINYKILSIFTGLLGLICIYLFSKQVSSPKIALISTFLAATSFWFTVWARLGNYNIVVPALSALTLYFFIRYQKYYKQKDLFLGIIISSIGIFTYPGVFILPIVFFLLLLYALFTTRDKFWYRKIILALIGFLPFFLVFALLVVGDQDNFAKGYIGTKLLHAGDLTISEFFTRLIRNLWRGLLMLHVEGDVVFRWNVSKSPHLDIVSGLFFLIGILFVWQRLKKYFWYFIIPILVLPLPSLWPGHPPVEVPNSPRTMSIMPIVFFITAFAIWTSYLRAIHLLGKYAANTMLVLILVIILGINLHKYFFLYSPGLPNKNTPFGKIIAEYIDTLPITTNVRLTSCCWGDWGQPEPKAIYYVLKHQDRREDIIHKPFLTSCEEVRQVEDTLIIFNPYDVGAIETFKQCFPQGRLMEHRVNAEDVFTYLRINAKNSLFSFN